MKIPSDAFIPMEKLTKYLLVPREYDDKSKFLSLAGFALKKPEVLMETIREFIETHEAVEDGENDYGEFYRADGLLAGPNGRELSVVTIWLRWKSDDKFHFVTLKPFRGDRRET